VLSVDLMHDSGDVQASENYQTIQCLGCDSISFRLVRSNSEDFDVTLEGDFIYSEREEVYPPRAAGRPKLTDSYLLPYRVREVYEETYKALSSEMYVLAAIGIRTLVEAVCDAEDAQGRGPKNKIDSLVKLGVLTKDGAQILHKVRQIGNLAAHEVKRHDPKTLGTAFDVAENLLQNVYILPASASLLDQ
jgi:hypothetical protein